MSNDIKVGDVCEVIDGCCLAARKLMLGADVLVVTTTCCLGLPMECNACGMKCDDWRTLVCAAIPESATNPLHFPTKFLRKKPPKQTDDAEPRLEHIPAEREFVEDLQRRLNKTTEPA